MQVDMVQTLALGVLALFLGRELNSRISVLRRICIPTPVTGGLVIAALLLLLHSAFGIDMSFDGSLKDVCMLMFFTTAGLQCNLLVLRNGGRHLLMLVLLVAVLIIFQNIIGIGLSRLMGENSLLGLAAGSVTMAGGHGTAGGFSGLLESNGLYGAASITMAAATFGLLAGSLIGGPLGNRLICRYNLTSPDGVDAPEKISESVEYQSKRLVAVCIVAAVAGAGSLLSRFFADIGLTVPTYFGSLIVAIVVRNVSELVPRCPKLPMNDTLSVGYICLSLFLGMAMVSLRLWELSGIALPLLAILVIQIAVMFVFARFVAFPLLGRDFDAAVLVSGLCGFGLGATPNALANMNAVCSRHGWSHVPFIVVPIVGAAFVDIINVSVITFFLNIL